MRADAAALPRDDAGADLTPTRPDIAFSCAPVVFLALVRNAAYALGFADLLGADSGALAVVLF
jgi:hypothetical protein